MRSRRRTALWVAAIGLGLGSCLHPPTIDMTDVEYPETAKWDRSYCIRWAHNKAGHYDSANASGALLGPLMGAAVGAAGGAAFGVNAGQEAASGSVMGGLPGPTPLRSPFSGAAEEDRLSRECLRQRGYKLLD